MKNIENLMQMALGATMTQVALCRFLLREKVIDRDRLLAFLEERGQRWGKSASDEALVPLVTIIAALQTDEEAEAFPATFH
jgi:hypothetical protein